MYSNPICTFSEKISCGVRSKGCLEIPNLSVIASFLQYVILCKSLIMWGEDDGWEGKIKSKDVYKFIGRKMQQLSHTHLTTSFSLWGPLSLRDVEYQNYFYE